MKIDEILIEMPTINNMIDHHIGSLNAPEQQKILINSFQKFTKNYIAAIESYYIEKDNKKIYTNYEDEVLYYFVVVTYKNKFPHIEEVWKNKDYTKNTIYNIVEYILNKDYGFFISGSLSVKGSYFVKKLIEKHENVYAIVNNKVVDTKEKNINIFDNYTKMYDPEFEKYSFLISKIKFEIGDSI
jgi:hypothetical protein